MVKTLLTGNAAAAWGARLAQVDYVPAFPITPQTEIIETLAGWFEDGQLRGRFVMMDSEHSMITAAGAAAATGVRTFTATSSQGLVYAMEALYSIAGWRVPLVLVEAYGNTGFQTSGASAFSSRTATSPGGVMLPKTDLFEIWRAQKPPYLATVTAHEALDLADKVHRSLAVAGPKLLISLAVCPTGWGFDPELSDQIARLAVDTGVWPLKEAVNGMVRHTYIPERPLPVAEYLEPQRRFRHLFRPRRQDDLIGTIQARVDSYWLEVRQRELGRAKPGP